MEIIPAIDLINGKCVRLTQGDYSQKKEYNENPLEIAKRFEDAGLKKLHLVDLDGARQKKIVNHKVLEKIATGTSLHIDFGGGVQSDDDINIAFNSGAKQITGGSIAIKNKPLFLKWLQNFGPNKIILGADVKQEFIAISGWEEKTEVNINEFLKDYTSLGVSNVICTDVSKDGLMQGPSFELYKKIIKNFPKIKLIASGGVTTIDDLIKLKEDDLAAAIVGKAFYEGTIKLNQLHLFL